MSWAVAAVMVAAMVAAVARGEDDLMKKCGDDFTKLSDCMKYSTGKEDTPSDKCCRAVSDIKANDPVCLCYIIQQTYKSSSATTNAGLRLDRLSALPAACKIPNANISICPSLLKLPAGSPDNAIFNGSAQVPGSSNVTNDYNSALTVAPSYSAVFAAAISAILSSLF